MKELLDAIAVKEQLTALLSEEFSTTPEKASNNQLYHALCLMVKRILAAKRKAFMDQAVKNGQKQVHYLSMEFLLGRSLKNSLANLGLDGSAARALKDWKVNLEALYELEPDAGLGNGGLGRLAACYLDAMATCALPATGYSICYEFGIFRQKLEDGWQTELPDTWLPGGSVWLTERPSEKIEVRFGGNIQEIWDGSYHSVEHKDYVSVYAVPCDLFISGFDTKGVSLLRLFKAESSAFDMSLFNSGNFSGAMNSEMTASVISKVLYPNDNFQEGKLLRLRQQYFLSCAAVNDIVKKHLETYGTMENFAQKNAIHINDTHPTLAIPELMRLLLDECGYSWEKAWDIVTKTFAYTNHTILSEALETWDQDMFRNLLPRIYQIVHEINERFCRTLYERTGDLNRVASMAVLANHQVRMANLCVAACHRVNGVSALHSEILKKDLFASYCQLWPEKFTNVTNGIAARRWLYQSNPGLTALLRETIGEAFLKDMNRLIDFLPFQNDPQVLERLHTIKQENKQRLCDYIRRASGVTVNPCSLFDVQVKRLHEYKRQQLNALHILTEYLWIKDHPNAPFAPKSYLFGAKAAPGYYMAKQIIRLLCILSKAFEEDPQVRDKLRIVYLEDYRVTLSELLMPAAEISEQISLAGKEASGTGNMKLMLNGAVTLGTLDGANVEIAQRVGPENIFIFGMKAQEAKALARSGSYQPQAFYEKDNRIHRAIDLLYKGIGGQQFKDVADMLRFHDSYMTLKDFDDYCAAHEKAGRLYQEIPSWQRMSLVNIAQSGYFCADRSVREYAEHIWDIPVEQ